MTLALSDTRAPSAFGVHERLVRGVLFLACFLLATLTASPFPDLGTPALLDPIVEGSRLGQSLTLILTLTLGTFVLVRARWVVFHVLTAARVLTLLWFAVTALASAHSELALRRLLLAVFTVANATALLVLPADREHFGR